MNGLISVVGGTRAPRPGAGGHSLLGAGQAPTRLGRVATKRERDTSLTQASVRTAAYRAVPGELGAEADSAAVCVFGRRDGIIYTCATAVRELLTVPRHSTELGEGDLVGGL